MNITSLLEMQKLYNSIIPKNVADILRLQEVAKKSDIWKMTNSDNMISFALSQKNATESLWKSIKQNNLIFDNIRSEFTNALAFSSNSPFIIDKKHYRTFADYQRQFKKVYSNLAIIEFVKEWEKVKRLIQFNYDFEDLVDVDEPNEKALVIDESSRIQKIVYDLYEDDSRLFTLEPRDFEELIAELLRKQGFEVELTKQTRDGGYDIIAMRSIDKHIPFKFLVECKRFAAKRPVGIGIIRGFKEVVETEGANRGIIVTTSYFTRDAKEKQKKIPYMLDLKEKNDIMAWVHDYYKSFKI